MLRVREIMDTIELGRMDVPRYREFSKYIAKGTYIGGLGRVKFHKSGDMDDYYTVAFGLHGNEPVYNMIVVDRADVEIIPERGVKVEDLKDYIAVYNNQFVGSFETRAEARMRLTSEYNVLVGDVEDIDMISLIKHRYYSKGVRLWYSVDLIELRSIVREVVDAYLEGCEHPEVGNVRVSDYGGKVLVYIGNFFNVDKSSAVKISFVKKRTDDGSVVVDIKADGEGSLEDQLERYLSKTRSYINHVELAQANKVVGFKNLLSSKGVSDEDFFEMLESFNELPGEVRYDMKKHFGVR